MLFWVREIEPLQLHFPEQSAKGGEGDKAEKGPPPPEKYSQAAKA